jgi:hypothetical protein
MTVRIVAQRRERQRIEAMLHWQFKFWMVCLQAGIQHIYALLKIIGEGEGTRDRQCCSDGEPSSERAPGTVAHRCRR